MTLSNLGTFSISTKDWSFSWLLNKGDRFKPVPRISINDPNLVERIKQYETDGIPLVIDHWHEHTSWPSHIFDLDWVLANLGDDPIKARNVHDRSDKTITLRNFIDQCRDQSRSSETNQELLYGKDVTCPDAWKDWLHGDSLPELLRPESTNDLFQHLDSKEKVESIMCYLGIRDTFTPAHKDLCASSGHNLMCHTEDGGASFWFMTASSNAQEVDSYFSNEIGKELDWEDHVASVEDFAKAPFTVYIVEQTLGDLVLVPPRSCHQVVNYGGLTVKTSWSRMTVSNISTAIYHELPMYRRVCRPEQYRIKHILYRALIHYTKALQTVSGSNADTDTRSSEASKLKELLSLFDHVLREEYTEDHQLLMRVNEKIRKSRTKATSPTPCDDSATRASSVEKTHSSRPVLSFSDCTTNLACDFCGADLFQSFFECPTCNDDHKGAEEVGNGILICPSCYVEGRTCRCGTMEPVQCRSFNALLEARNDAATIFKTGPYCDSTIDCLNSEQLLNSPGVFTFQAGCILKQQRSKTEHKAVKTRKCNSLTPSHDVSYDGLVYCARCHSSQCYRHLLKKGIHSSEAILLHKKSSVTWHNFHLSESQERTKHSKEQIKVGEGRLPECFGHKLAILANTFGKCKPMNDPVKLGFYDTSSESGPITDSVSNSDGQHQEVYPMMLEDTSLSGSPEIPILFPKTTKDSDSDEYLPSSSRGISRKRRSVSRVTSQSNKRVKVTSTRERPKNLADVINANKGQSHEASTSTSRVKSRIILSSDDDEPIASQKHLLESIPRVPTGTSKPRIAAKPNPHKSSSKSTTKVRDDAKTLNISAIGRRRGPPGIPPASLQVDDESSEEDEVPKVFKAKRRPTRPATPPVVNGPVPASIPSAPPAVDLDLLLAEMARMREDMIFMKEQTMQTKNEMTHMKDEMARLKEEATRKEGEMVRMQEDLARVSERNSTLERESEERKSNFTARISALQIRVEELTGRTLNASQSLPPLVFTNAVLAPEWEQEITNLFERLLSEQFEAKVDKSLEQAANELLELLSVHNQGCDALWYTKLNARARLKKLFDFILQKVYSPPAPSHRPYQQRHVHNWYGNAAGPSNGNFQQGRPFVNDSHRGDRNPNVYHSKFTQGNGGMPPNHPYGNHPIHPPRFNPHNPAQLQSHIDHVTLNNSEQSPLPPRGRGNDFPPNSSFHDRRSHRNEPYPRPHTHRDHSLHSHYDRPRSHRHIQPRDSGHTPTRYREQAVERRNSRRDRSPSDYSQDDNDDYRRQEERSPSSSQGTGTGTGTGTSRSTEERRKDTAATPPRPRDDEDDDYDYPVSPRREPSERARSDRAPSC